MILLQFFAIALISLAIIGAACGLHIACHLLHCKIMGEDPADNNEVAKDNATSHTTDRNVIRMVCNNYCKSEKCTNISFPYHIKIYMTICIFLFLAQDLPY